jgi:hypothetical protein
LFKAVDHLIENGSAANVGAAGNVQDGFTWILTARTYITNTWFPIGEKMIDPTTARNSLGKPVMERRRKLIDDTRKNHPVD